MTENGLYVIYRSTRLNAELASCGVATLLLDGDELRRGLCKDLGYSPADRRENIRRAGELARTKAEAGCVVIASFISPYRSDRDALRAKIENFIEVHVKCPVAVCQNRDPKGLYKKALGGELKDFTGISAPYEEPLKPDIVLDTNNRTIDACVDLLRRYVDARILST